MRADGEVLKEQVIENTCYLPGLPCPCCRGRVTAQWIRGETATAAEREQAARAAAEAQARADDGARYWIGERPQKLTVGYMPTAVAAMGAGYVQPRLTGSAAIPHNRFLFDLGLKSLGVVADEKQADSCCPCVCCVGIAGQRRADFWVTQPAHFAVCG